MLSGHTGWNFRADKLDRVDAKSRIFHVERNTLIQKLKTNIPTKNICCQAAEDRDVKLLTIVIN